MELFACDIETGPLPDDELLRLYEVPQKPGLFKAAAVDTGRATKVETINIKVAKARAAHDVMVADWDGYCDRDKAEWLDATRERAALSSLTGRVLAVGYWRNDEHGSNPSRINSVDIDEVDILNSWWNLCRENCGDRFVFHNGFGFDLPFLVRRSWILDVTVPDWVMSVRGSRVSFNQDRFLDTMITWTMGKYQTFISLNDLAKALGIEGKLKGCDGADFARMWYGTAEEQVLALEYLDQDVRVTMRAAQRMGLG